MALRPKNWSTFQHYKNRRPPWIRLYHSLLDNPDFHALKGEDAKYLMMIWLIASEQQDGSLPVLAELAFRLRLAKKKSEQLLSRLQAWLENFDSEMLATRKQPAAPDTEAEAEESRGEGDAERTTPPSDAPDFDADPEENIPEGLSPLQYAAFVLEQCAISAGFTLQRKLGEAIVMLSRVEICSMPAATSRMLERLRTAQTAGPVKVNFWLEDGGWKQREEVGVSTEGWE